VYRVEQKKAETALTRKPALDQRIEEPERSLAECLDIRVIELAAPFLDGAGDPHQRLVFQRLRGRVAALVNGLQWFNVTRWQ
jgi:hypothetical protein